MDSLHIYVKSQEIIIRIIILVLHYGVKGAEMPIIIIKSTSWH